MTKQEHTLKVLFPCSMTVAANVLVGNKAYPAIVADYQQSFARLKKLAPDVVLTAHPEVADILRRHQRQMAGALDEVLEKEIVRALLAVTELELEPAA